MVTSASDPFELILLTTFVEDETTFAYVDRVEALGLFPTAPPASPSPEGETILLFPFALPDALEILDEDTDRGIESHSLHPDFFKPLSDCLLLFLVLLTLSILI